MIRLRVPCGGSFLNREVERGKQLTFCLNIPGAHVDEPIQRLAWRGIADSVQFGVTVPNEPQVGNLIGTVTVSDGTVPFGHVKFVMSVGDALTENTAKAAALAKQSWKRYRLAFISYASPDRVEVLKRVQMLRQLSIEFFQDSLSLEPGERWAKALYKNIDKAMCSSSSGPPPRSSPSG